MLAPQLSIPKNLPTSRTRVFIDDVRRVHVLVDQKSRLLLGRAQIAVIQVACEVHKMHVDLVPPQLRVVLVDFPTNVAHEDLRHGLRLLRTPLYLTHLRQVVIVEDFVCRESLQAVKSLLADAALDVLHLELVFLETQPTMLIELVLGHLMVDVADSTEVPRDFLHVVTPHDVVIEASLIAEDLPATNNLAGDFLLAVLQVILVFRVTFDHFLAPKALEGAKCIACCVFLLSFDLLDLLNWLRWWKIILIVIPS